MARLDVGLVSSSPAPTFPPSMVLIITSHAKARFLCKVLNSGSYMRPGRTELFYDGGGYKAKRAFYHPLRGS